MSRTSDVTDRAFTTAPIGQIAVVVVTHSGPSAMLRDCLTSIAVAGGADLVFVVDNSDRSATPDPATSEYGPGVTEVLITPNRGYGAAANAGIKRAAEVVTDPDSLAIALLNDDVVVAEGWLPPLAGALDLDAHVGAVQPKLLMAGTDPVLVNSVGVRFDRNGAGVDEGFAQPDGPAWATGRAIQMFTGGAVLFRYDFLRAVGGFDSRYFLYYEDVDLALRGAELGWTYRCEPSSTVLHLGGATAGRQIGRVAYAQERNRLWVALRFGSPGHLARAVWLSVRRLRHQPRRLHASALVAGLRAGPRIVSERRRRPFVEGLAGPPSRRIPQLRGVNVLGYHHVTSGLGEAARQLVECFEAAGIPCVPIDVPSTGSPARRTAAAVPAELFDVTIAVVTAAELPGVLQTLPSVHAASSHLVGYWFWELAEVPPAHQAAVDLVDEIWAPTSFIRDAYEGGAKPVRLVPMRIPEPAVSGGDVERWRRRFDLTADSTLFVVSLDLFSDVNRKNPFGAIDAFVRAFGHEPDRPVRLLVKTINGDQRAADLDRVVRAAEADRRITVLDEHVGVDELHALIAAADCYVSLHRSEGLGLHLADAMWLGTPVLATRYSGNLDLMDDASAALVDAGLVAVGGLPGAGGAYGAQSVWADPDLDAAAGWMCTIADRGSVVRKLAEEARFRMELQPSARAMGLAYREQLFDRTANPSVTERRYLPDYNEMLHSLRTRSLRNVPAGATRLVSVGCAGRWYFDWIAENYGPVAEHVGVELYAPEPADLPDNIRWIAASAGDLHEIEQGSVDLVFSGQNIEHLWPADVVGFLVEANRVLRPGGTLVIDSPNRLVTDALNWSQPEHTVEFTADEARELLHLAGFTVRRLDGLWACRRDTDGQVPSLFAGSAAELRSRARTTVDDADESFVWWLEAERTGDPDVDGLQQRVEEIFAIAWPQRLTRTIVATGLDAVGDGRVRSEVGSPGVLFHGPYTPLTAGEYVAEFQVSTGATDGAIAARCVVVGDGVELAAVTVRDVPLDVIAVDFTLPDTTFGMQFRVESTGITPVECVPWVELHPPRPHGV